MTQWYTFTGGTFADTTSTAYFIPSFEIRYGPPPLPPVPKPLLDAMATLGLPVPVESWGVIQKRYRQLAKENHPDAGGDAERMKAINAAFTLLKETVKP